MGSSGARVGLTGLCLALATGAAAECRPDSLSLRGPEGGVMQFRVEVADEAAERSKGLMFRDHMASSAGMLFVYPAPQRAIFWMKNTLIPLDMVFFDATGRVTRVRPDAVPEDQTPIDGGDGVVAVLEINGGLAAKLGIGPGYELRHPALDQSMALWPCAGD
jgi:uncharacterized protein